jgi:hypothetical protein
VLRRRIGGLHGRGIETSAVRVLLISGAAGGAAWLAAHFIGWDTKWEAIASVIVGLAAAGAITIGGLALLRVEEFTELTALVKARRRRRAAAADVER